MKFLSNEDVLELLHYGDLRSCPFEGHSDVEEGGRVESPGLCTGMCSARTQGSEPQTGSSICPKPLSLDPYRTRITSHMRFYASHTLASKFGSTVWQMKSPEAHRKEP
jgi:hypothetical protein